MGLGNISDTKVSHYPPSLHPGFMGAPAPLKLGYGSSAHMEYFQNFRNENLSRITTPSYDAGMGEISYTPKPDKSFFTKSSQKYSTFPKSEISMLDACRQEEVDSFYMICQQHRDQYKDRTGSLFPLNYFKTSEYAYQCPYDPTSAYFKYPTQYIKYRQPITLPLTLERSIRGPLLPERALTGIYQIYSGR